MVDPIKAKQDKSWHKEPNIPYGFSAFGYVEVHRNARPLYERQAAPDPAWDFHKSYNHLTVENLNSV
jgi:hypothetical protein